MDNNIKKYLYDIHESLNSIKDYLGVKCDFSIYMESKMFRRVIERESEIIGEAMNGIDKMDLIFKYQVYES
ncbi:hypothetical protein EZS27_023558 [termite gut metagenome]|uniref:Uncharacterized protein n=1 Tax=termite gut metagenome TaxID=433724 RepID=A0A5J4R1H8_9ZZZZ